ncbi:FadR/GntR family transcriptional regulator [Variovorax sp. EL159]|uniref:FadR/GntR family transcriptional regulator n=1 Tax=Variovorax sp. EL159 TaxID=1566270 RepID=UPI000884EB07|nr:FadR/GntR family transcriptional regulator [Variovorax sp. EL159]SCX73202.1 transcriptional regulator, GntR family [Variovorax sp. EL159]
MHPPAKPADTRRLYQQIADQIRAFIRNGNLPSGARLPPERELALQLGVSRPSLREALIALEIDGRIEIRMGSGVYVCATQDASEHATPAVGESPSEMMQARAMLEGAVVTLASARVTSHHLDRVKSCLEDMRQDGLHGRTQIENDRRFHLTIAEMTGNSVLVRLVGELFDGRHSPISSRMSARTEDSQAWKAAFVEHEAIYRALEARDPQAAVAAMLHHLSASHARWTGEAPAPSP